MRSLSSQTCFRQACTEKYVLFLQRVDPCKVIMTYLDSGFHTTDLRIQIYKDSRTKTFWILDFLRILDSGFHRPDFGFQSN